MTPSTSHKRPSPPPRRSRSGWLVTAALVILAGALAFYLTRGKTGHETSHRQAKGEVRGSWQNRAVVRAPEAKPEGAPERPVIHGHVYDLEGTAIPGATLVALTYDLAGNMASPVGTFTSAEDGSFEIALNEGTYQLNAAKEGYGPTTIVANTGDEVSVVLPRGGTVVGKVLDEKGKPVRKFTIDLVAAAPADAPAPPPIWSKTFDSKDGSFQTSELPIWPVVVRASAPSFAPGFSSPLQVRPGDSRDVQLTLNAGCAIEGKVVDKEGNPVPKVLVNAEQRLNAGALTDPVIQAAMQDVSGTDGSFRLEHVPHGAMLVRGYDGDNAPSSVSVDVKDCDKLSPVKLVMSPGGSVEGRARRADGSKLPGARLTIVDRLVGIVNTRSDADGNFRFDDLPAGNFRVQLDSGSASAMTFVQVREGATSHLDMTLFEEGTGELRGTVKTGDKPLAGARLLVAANHGRAKGVAMYFPVTGADGSFRVPSLPQGAYLVNVMSTPAGQGIEVKKGETATIDIDVGPALGSLPPGYQPPAPNPHPRRLQQMRQQQQDQQQQGADSAGAEGATPTP
jgi:protocatechuate 3,4-dioxygenase beta subunit